MAFDLTGDKFFMVAEEKVGVHEAEDAKLVFQMESSKRVLCVVFQMESSKRVLCAAPGSISLFSLPSSCF